MPETCGGLSVAAAAWPPVARRQMGYLGELVADAAPVAAEGCSLAGVAGDGDCATRIHHARSSPSRYNGHHARPRGGDNRPRLASQRSQEEGPPLVAAMAVARRENLDARLASEAESLSP